VIMSKRSISRGDALRRSCMVFDRAVQQFRRSPTAPARNALQLSMAAMEWASLLATDPHHNTGRRFDVWELAWVYAYVAVYRLAKGRVAN
jgi:hypothetical protein